MGTPCFSAIPLIDRLIRVAGYRLAIPLLNGLLKKERENPKACAAAYTLKGIAPFYLGELDEAVACLDKAMSLERSWAPIVIHHTSGSPTS